MHRILTALLLAFFALLGGPAAVSAASAQQEVQEIFAGWLDVQEIQVDVVVTDPQGNRVPGLKASDFRLLVEGKEVTVESFSEVRDGQPVDTDPAGALQSEASGANNYLLFIDETFAPYTMRDEALKGIARDVRSMGPQDRMAVLSYNGRRLKIFCPWTPGGPELEKLLRDMIRHNGSLSESGPELQLARSGSSISLAIGRFKSRFDGAFEDVASFFRAGLSKRAVAEAYLNSVTKRIASATAAMQSFGEVPGRKNLVMLTGGWLVPTKDLLEPGGKEISLMQPLVDSADRLGFTIYPMYLAYPPTGLDGRYQMSFAIRHDALSATAFMTGGKLLRQGRNRHLLKVQADTQAYYRLSFTYTGDDQRRRIAVEVVGHPGLQARSRRGFMPVSRQTRIAAKLESALLTGQMEGMSPLGVSLGKACRTAGNRVELPVTVRIPIDQITLVEYPGRKVGQLDLRIGAIEDDGNFSELLNVPAWIMAEETPAPGAVEIYEAKVSMSPATQILQLVLSDVPSAGSFGERIRVAHEPAPPPCPPSERAGTIIQ